MTVPPDLQRVQMIDVLCQRWHCLPSELLQEDVGLITGILGVLAVAEGASEPLGAAQDGAISQRANSGHPGAQGSIERTLAAASRGL